MSLLESNEICYICQEDCPDELSPCKCKIPVHQQCMNEFRRVSENSEFRNKCSVCQGEYTTLPIHQPQQQRRLVIRRTYVNRRTYNSYFMGRAILWLGLYVLYGYIGKVIFYRYDNGVEIEGDEYWNPLNAIHLCYAVLVHTVIQIIINGIKFMYKRQMCCIIEYEEFEDNGYISNSDTDDSDSEDLES